MITWFSMLIIIVTIVIIVKLGDDDKIIHRCDEEEVPGPAVSSVTEIGPPLVIFHNVRFYLIKISILNIMTTKITMVLTARKVSLWRSPPPSPSPPNKQASLLLHRKGWGL